MEKLETLHERQRLAAYDLLEARRHVSCLAGHQIKARFNVETAERELQGLSKAIERVLEEITC